MHRAFFGTCALLILVAASAVSTALAQQAPLGTTQHPTLGAIATDASGRTVYTWAGDTQGANTSSCNGACANAWPPVLIDADAAMMMDPAGVLSTLQREDGAYQLALNGWPLYLFRGDNAPGEANGNGSNGFGALWSVVGADALAM